MIWAYTLLHLKMVMWTTSPYVFQGLNTNTVFWSPDLTHYVYFNISVQHHWISVHYFLFDDNQVGSTYKHHTNQVNNVTYSGCSIHDGSLLYPKSQYTTVKHSRQLLEHTYTSDPHSLGTPTSIEFFQQDLLWQSSNTHSILAVRKLPNTRRGNPSSGYRSTCTPQWHFGV
jgi:hypothetical protein